MDGMLILAAFTFGPFLIAYGLAKIFSRNSALFEMMYVLIAVLIPVLWLVNVQQEADAFSRAGTAILLPFVLVAMTFPAWAGVYFARPKETGGIE
jgi:hypothetical protein